MLYKKQDVQEISWERYSIQINIKNTKEALKNIIHTHTPLTSTHTHIYVHLQYTRNSNIEPMLSHNSPEKFFFFFLQLHQIHLAG